MLCVLAGCGRGMGGPAVAVQEQPWTSAAKVAGVQLLTDHYDLRLTTQDAELREYLPVFMETAFAEYSKLIPPARASTEPLLIYVFQTRSEWAAFTRSFVPDQAYTYMHIHSGGYMDYPSATAVLWDLGRDRTLSLIAHEGLHQYLARYLPEPVIPWINEGLATQFEAFDLGGDRPVFTPEKNFLRTNDLREALTLKDGLIPLPKLLSMHAGQAVTKTGQATRGYYTQLWSMVLFLRRDKQYAKPFANLLADSGTPRLRTNLSAYRAATPDAQKLSDGEVVFHQYLTEDLDAFMSAYTEFARQLVR